MEGFLLGVADGPRGDNLNDGLMEMWRLIVGKHRLEESPR